MTGTKNHKLLILTASFFVLIFVLNYEIYKFYTDSIKSQNSILLNSYKTSIERYVGSDLKIIDAVNTEREQIFILQSLKNNNAKKSLVNISSIGASKFLYYDKNDHSIFGIAKDFSPILSLEQDIRDTSGGEFVLPTVFLNEVVIGLLGEYIDCNIIVEAE